VQDSLFAFKKSISDHTKIKLSQFVPNNKWFLVPNPNIKVTHAPPLGKGAAVFEVIWDTLARSGGGCATVYAGKDKEYKASVEMHSTKVRNEFISSSTVFLVTARNSSCLLFKAF
jgi:hypothetical protein